MKYRTLGKSNIEVSTLCFGSLVMGPLQANLQIDEGAEIISYAASKGVNFIDTAELYMTYPYIKKAIKQTNKDFVISTKTYAYTAEGAEKSLEKARKEMNLDVIDIFMLHEQESKLTLRGHREALDYFLNAKSKGLVRAVGVSTHNIEVVFACAQMPEIDVVHPLINKSGIGIGDGSINEMLEATQKAYDNEKGIFSMKALGGGNLIKDFNEALAFVLEKPFIHSVAMGMKSSDEVDVNCAIFDEMKLSEEVLHKVNEFNGEKLRQNRKLHIDYWCEGCGKCVERCKNGAIEVRNGKAYVITKKCVMCSYCAASCPLFAIKIY